MKDIICSFIRESRGGGEKEKRKKKNTEKKVLGFQGLVYFQKNKLPIHQIIPVS